MKMCELYEKNRQLVNDYRWFMQTNCPLPEYKEIEKRDIPKGLVRRSDTIERPFFLNLDKPILLKSEYNTYHIEYVVENVRKSEYYGGDNHIYLWYKTIYDLAELLCLYDMQDVLKEEKVFFLIGEKSLLDNYPFDFKNKAGIDYDSLEASPYRINEIKRVVIDNPTGDYSGNVFMAGILDAHPNLLTMKGFGGSGFAYIYNNAFKDRDIAEAKEYVELSFSSYLLREFYEMFLFHKWLDDDSIIYPVPDWEDFWGILENKFRGYSMTPGNWIRAFFLAYDEALWGCRNSRIAPAIRLTTHFNGKIARNKEKRPFIDSFRYVRRIEIHRNTVMKIASNVATKVAQTKYITDPSKEFLANIVEKEVFIPEEERYCGAKWILPSENTYNSIIIRFEDLKLQSKDALCSLCVYLDIPFDKIMWYTTDNGKRSAYYSPVTNTRIDDYNSKPARDYKPHIMTDWDIYRLELIHRQELEAFGYEFYRYDGKSYSDDEIRNMFSEPFGLEDKVYTKKLQGYMSTWRKSIADNVEYRLKHRFGETEDGERLIPTPYIDVQNENDKFYKYGGEITDDRKEYLPKAFNNNKHKGASERIKKENIEEMIKRNQEEIIEWEQELLNIEKEINRKYRRIYLYGAGTFGRQIANRLSATIDSKRISFLDKDVNKHGKKIVDNIICYPLSEAYGMSQDAVILITPYRSVDDITDELCSKEMQISGRLKGIAVQGRYSIILSKLKEKALVLQNREVIIKTFGLLSDNLSKYYMYTQLWQLNYRDEIAKILSLQHVDETGSIKERVKRFAPKITMISGKVVVCGFFTQELIDGIVVPLLSDADVDVFEGNEKYAHYLNEKYQGKSLNYKVNVRNVVPGFHSELITEEKYDGRFGKYGYLEFLSGESVKSEPLDKYYTETDEVGLVVIDFENATSNVLRGAEQLIKSKRPYILTKCAGNPASAPDEYPWSIIELINEWKEGYSFALCSIPQHGLWLCAFAV